MSALDLSLAGARGAIVVNSEPPHAERCFFWRPVVKWECVWSRVNGRVLCMKGLRAYSYFVYRLGQRGFVRPQRCLRVRSGPKSKNILELTRSSLLFGKPGKREALRVATAPDSAAGAFGTNGEPAEIAFSGVRTGSASLHDSSAMGPLGITSP